MDINHIFNLVKNLLKTLRLNSKFAFILSGIAICISVVTILYKLRLEIFSKNGEKLELNENISMIFKDMLSEMNKKFLNYYMAPIVLNINPTKVMPTLGSDTVRFSNSENVHWVVNDRMAIVSILRNHEYIIKKLQDLTGGFGFQCVVFYLDYDQIVDNDSYKVDCLSILNQYRNIMNKFGINARCFVMTHMNGVSFINDKRSVIGVENESDSFVDIFANNVMINSAELDMNVFAAVNNLSNISSYFFDMFKHYGLDFGGFYMCSSMSNEYTLIENFLILNCYNACMKVKVNFRYYSTKSKVISIIRNTLFAFMLIVVPLMFAKTYLLYGDCARTEKVLHDMYQEKPISTEDSEHVRLQTEIDSVSYGLMNLLFQNGDIASKTEKLISDYNIKMLDNKTHEDQAKEVFDRSPADTVGYSVVLQDLSWIDKNIHINESNAPVIFNKVDSICDKFFDNYYNTSLIIKVEKFLQILEKIESEAISPERVEIVSSLKKALIDIDKYFVSNLWWTSDEYELKFKSDVESLVGNVELCNRVLSRHDEFLKGFRAKVHNYQHRSFGKVFDSKFDLSNDFKKFRDECYDIFDDIIFSINFSDLVIPSNKHSFPYFDVRVLQKNISTSNVTSKINAIKDDRQKNIFTKIVNAQRDIYNTYLVCSNVHFNDSLSVFDKINNIVDFCEFSRSIGMNEFYIQDLIVSSLNTISEEILLCVNRDFIKLDAYEMKSVISGNVTDLFAKYSNVVANFKDLSKSIDKLVFYLKEYNIKDLNKITQLKDSIDDKSGPLIRLSEFINSISKFDDKYRREYELIDANGDLLNLKCVNFMNEVIVAHNDSLNSINVKAYQKMVRLFNSEIKDYFNHFNKSNLDYQSVVGSIKDLIGQFEGVKDNLYSDKYFTENKDLMRSLNNLQNFVNMFSVQDDKLFIKMKIRCHVVDEINDEKFMTALVHSYSIVTADNRYKDTLNNGIIDCLINCNDTFEFHITMAEQIECIPSKVSYANFSTYVEGNMYKIAFNRPLNFIDFANNQLKTRISDKNVIKEMVFAVKNQYNEQKYVKTGFIFDNFKVLDLYLHSFDE